jgi:phosphomannomutase/phosphoglucomutase
MSDTAFRFAFVARRIHAMVEDQFRSMFREYDIRGRVSQEELNPQHVKDIAQGFATFLRRQRPQISSVVVGYDNRSYSPQFAEAAIAGLVSCGFDVFDIGLSLSPVLYFAQYHLRPQSSGTVGGVMITASHNPDGWSGFKLAHGESQTLGPKEIADVYEIVRKRDFAIASPGSCKAVSVKDPYIDQMVNRISLNRANAPRIVIDAGNGGAGVFAYELYQRIGCLTFQLYCDPDTRYPNYFPNPSNLQARKRLAEMVTHPYIKADLGIGFDGDGDRIGVLDENGNNVWSDRILLLLARQLLQKQKGAKIVFDVKCTQALNDDVISHGGLPIMWKTGHSHIKAKMHQEKAQLAGERSGHIFIGGSDYYGFDDALFTGAKLVEYVSHIGKPFSQILADLPQFVTSPEIHAHCPDNVKYDVVDRLVKMFKAEYGDRVIDINGARVQFGDGWGLVRASSNLPELVLIFEAKTEQRMREIRGIFRQALAKFPEIDSKWENDLP